VDAEREDFHLEKLSETETVNRAVDTVAESIENTARNVKHGRRKPKPFSKLSAQEKRRRLRERKQKKQKRKDDQKVLELLLDSNCKQEENDESVYECCRAQEIPMIRRYGKFLCGVCLKPFSRFQALTYHSYTHTGNWPYVCAICEKHFTRSSLLKKHMFCHDNRELFICVRCKKPFTSWVTFQRHIFHQSGREGDYKCTMCEKEFSNPNALKNHMQYHENKEAFVCPICEKELTNPQSLRRHVERHVSGPAKESDHSSRKHFHNVEDTRGHVLIHAMFDETKSVEHGIACTQLAEQQSSVDCDTKPEFTCTKCAKAFPTLDNLEDHMFLHASARPHKCTQCEEQFSLPASLSIHMKKHTEPSISSVHLPKCNQSKSYTCSECGKTLTSQWGYKTHVFLHSGRRPHRCITCGERFALIAHLRSHMFVHRSKQEGLSHKCTICEKEFSHPTSLQNHLQYHKNKDSFACPICSKQLTSSWGLKGHIQRLHVTGCKKENQTNPKSEDTEFLHPACLQNHMHYHKNKDSFVCPVCSKQLTSSWGLKEHVRRTHVVASTKEIQTNPKSYTCGECGKTLTTQQGYSTHVFLHTGKRPHGCTVCDKTFALANHLRNHMDVHHNDRKLFPCSECSKRLISQRALDRHMTVHSGTQSHCCTECSRRLVLWSNRNTNGVLASEG